MSITSSNYAADAYVTAANPAPGRDEIYAYLVNSGTGFEERYTTKSDGGIGLNVYIAGGTGPSGTIAVSQTNPTQITLSGVSISGIMEVTTSAGNPVQVTGSVYVLNPGGSLSGVLTATITGVVEVSQSNVPATQSVYITQQPIGVTGTVSVSGTASVNVVSLPQPLGVSGSVSVSGTASVSVTNFPAVVTVSGTGAFGVTVSNLPATQSVFVVNQASSSITGTVTVSGTGVFQVTGSVFVLNPSSASLVISGALEVTSSQANPVWVTGNIAFGSASSPVVFIPPNAVSTASVVTVVPQTSSVVSIMTASDKAGYDIYNSSSANLYLYFGPATGTASYFLVPGAVYESQDMVFAGDVWGSWSASGTGGAVVTVYLPDPSGSSGSFTLNVGNVVQVTGTVSIAGFSGTISGSGGGMPPASASSPAEIIFSTSSVTLLAANSARKGFSIYNDSDQTYLVRLGAIATTGTWTFSLFTQQFYESPYPGYTGIVTGIGYTTGSGTIHVEEMS